MCTRSIADALLCFLCPVVSVGLIVEQAAAVENCVLEVTVACDRVVVVSCEMVSMLGLSVSMIEGRGGRVFVFCQLCVIG